MNEATVQTSKAQMNLSNLFDISRFDTGFMDDISLLLKPKTVAKRTFSQTAGAKAAPTAKK